MIIEILEDRDLTLADVEHVAEKLIGTCNITPDNVNEAIHTVEGFAKALDAIAFECVTCGWWYSTDELSENEDEYECQECYDD